MSSHQTPKKKQTPSRREHETKTRTPAPENDRCTCSWSSGTCSHCAGQQERRRCGHDRELGPTD